MPSEVNRLSSRAYAQAKTILICREVIDPEILLSA
jgi:hypothetical protein